uniref:Uncharacterized protein n=1 Tax=Solanum lycopersicum TaxID=4081 RepID=A0A3Q7IY50_SOLLC
MLAKHVQIGQIDPTTWIMMDVSYDLCNEIPSGVHSYPWKFPSGCPIQDMGIIVCPDGRLSLDRDSTANAENNSILTNEKGTKKIWYMVSYSVAASDLDSSTLLVVNDFVHKHEKHQNVFSTQHDISASNSLSLRAFTIKHGGNG